MEFTNRPLGNMSAVGLVRAHSARLWVRAEHAGLLMVRWWPEDRQDSAREMQVSIPANNDNDNTVGFDIPGPGDGRPSLRPLTRYHYEVRDAKDGSLFSVGSFETAPAATPETADEFAIALMSCHQPFDAEGRLLDRSVDMLRASLKCLRDQNAKLVLMVGDQMYSDYPKKLSLFNSSYFPNIAPPGRRTILECNAAEVRALFHRRYRHFFGIPEWQQIHAEFPVCPILDDHDLVDNWGSEAYFQEPAWQQFGQGARAAYFDYQGKRVLQDPGALPDDFDVSLEYGCAASYALDLRSNRTGTDSGQLFSAQQERRFREFLEAQSNKKVIFVVLSVPIIHLPRKLAKLLAHCPAAGEDFSDRWSTGPHIRDRDRFLRIIADHRMRHPHQQVLFLSGDIHIACVHQITWEQGPIAYQMISSGFTHRSGAFMRAASKALIGLNRSFATLSGDMRGRVQLLGGVGARTANPFGDLNLGLIKVRTDPSQSRAQLRFQIYGHQGPAPRCVYESPIIDPP